MDKNNFEENFNMLKEILEQSKIGEQMEGMQILKDGEKEWQEEKVYRLKRLRGCNYQSKESINEYFGYSHEIRSLEFLEKNEEKLEISMDHHKEGEGTDFNNSKCYIECVCSSLGESELDKLWPYDEKGHIIIRDYKKIEDEILSRIICSIKKKKKMYKKKYFKIIDKNPYIIFLGIGGLSDMMFSPNNGSIMNKILFGIENEIFIINSKTGKIENKGLFSHRDLIKKSNSSSRDCNIFDNTDNSCISAIIFAQAKWNEHYNETNTFLFINPFAKNKIDKEDFPYLKCWKLENILVLSDLNS